MLDRVDYTPPSKKEPRTTARGASDWQLASAGRGVGGQRNRPVCRRPYR